MNMYSLLSADKATWYPILFDSPFSIVRSVLIWFTIAIIIGYCVVFFLLKNNPNLLKAKKPLLIGAIVYACALSLTLLILRFMEDGIVAILFYPILALIVIIAISAILLMFRRDSAAWITVSILFSIGAIVLIVCMGIHFAGGEAAARNWITNETVKPYMLILFAAIALSVLLFVAFYIGRKDKTGFSSRSMTYAAIAIAMSFALSFIRIVKMPQGGSITVASLLPLMIYAYMFGVKKGIFAGMIYGLLQAFQDSYILHPAQFLLDYPLAFACVGIAGIFATLGILSDKPQLQFAFGAIIAGVWRFFVHFISGIFAFGAFAPEGTPVALYSLTYNCLYVFPDLAICVVVGVLLFSSKSFVATVRKQRSLN